MRRAFMYLMPLWMPLAMFGFVCITDGVDLTVKRDGDMVVLYASNCTYSCAQLQWSPDLNNNWTPWRSMMTHDGDVFSTNFLFRIPVNNERTFWRLRDCAAQ